MSKAMWGGLLSGLGQGIVTQGEQMRLDALERAKMLQRTTERAEDRTNQVADQNTQFSNQQKLEGTRHANNLAIDTAQGTRQTERDKEAERVQRARDAATQAHELTKTGMTVNAKATAGRKGQMTDSQLLAFMEGKHNTGDANYPVIDRNAAAADLERQGRKDLADIMRDALGSGPKDDALWSEAKAAADKWVNNKAGWTSTDATDFADYEGDREKAREAKAQEIYRQRRGLFGGAPEKSSASGSQNKAEPTPKAADKSKLSGPAASGSLVRDEQGNVTGSRPSQGDDGPVQLSSKAQYDALPSGTLFIDPTGQVRRKP